jgi:hypothetical protein
MRREPSSLLRLVPGLLLAGAAAAAALGGCGSRGPLDEATNVVADAAPEAAPPIEAGPEAAPPVADAGREAGPVACGLCVATTCGDEILACIQSAECRAVLQCVGTTCLGGGGGGNGGGGLNPLCLFQCAGNDPSGALGVLSIFQCVTGKCGEDCSSLLGGLGGLGGGGGGGGGKGGGKGGNGGGDNGNGSSPEAFRELFSPWPELFSTAPANAPSFEAARPER